MLLQQSQPINCSGIQQDKDKKDERTRRGWGERAPLTYCAVELHVLSTLLAYRVGFAGKKQRRIILLTPPPRTPNLRGRDLPAGSLSSDETAFICAGDSDIKARFPSPSGRG